MKKTILIALFLCMAGSMTCFADVIAVHEDNYEDRAIGDPTEGWHWFDNSVSHVGTYVDFEGSIVREHAGTLAADINQRFGYKTDIEMTGNTSEDPCDYTLELDMRNLQGNWDPHILEIWILTYNPDTGGSTYGYGLPVLELYQEDEWVHVTANLGDLVELGRNWWEGTGWDMTNPTWSYEIGGPGWPGVEVVGDPWTQIFLVDNLKITMVVEPPEFARNPIPEDQSIDIPRDVVLSWTPGDFADKRNVYFGTSADDVNQASVDNPLGVLVGQEQQETTYDPPGLLDYNKTYYWRVDELNDTEPNSPWRGRVWSFTTANFILVEDFEDYNDYPPDEVWNTWIDGYADPLNGSTAGYPDPDFNADEHYLEGDNVNSGDWSLPLFYDNAAGISEVTRSLAGTVTDWTTDDVVTLTLFYYGGAANAAESMYVVVNGSAVVTNDDAGAALVTEWTRWDIPLQDLADMGVNLNNVNSLTIGLGDKANPTAGGGSGMVLIDDIRLYHSLSDEQEPEPVEPAEPVDPGTEGLVAYYSLDGDVSDGSGNGNDGTIVGNPEFVSDGAVGSALDFSGDDYVDCGNSPLFDVSDALAVAVWVNIRSIPQAWTGVITKGNDSWRVSNNNLSTGMHFGFEDGSRGWQAANSATELPMGEWHHVCGVYDINVGAKIYIDGLEDGSNPDTEGITHSDYNVYIGENSESLNSMWDGGIDEVYIYDRPLSAGEVLYLASQ